MEVIDFRVLMCFNQELLFYLSFTVFAVPVMQGCDNMQDTTIPNENN